VQKEVFEKVDDVWKIKKDAQGKQITKEIQVPKDYKKPWGTDEGKVLAKSSTNFTDDAKKELEKIVVSFKQNLRVINKATNKYEKIKDGKKIKINQEGTNWAIRKPLHKDTVFAKVSLRKIKTVRLNIALKDWKSIVDKELKEEIKRLNSLYGSFDEKIVDKYFKDRKYQLKDVDVSKVEIYYFDHENAATRKNLDTSFNVKAIESITDSGIQKILLNHLATKENNPDLAFSPEGIEEMNQNIVNLNNGKFHQPIYKVRVYEPIGNKFQVGYIGNKKDKYVEAAKGTNLFFAIYVDEDNHRSYETIPLNIVVERLKQDLNAVPEKNEKGHNLLFHLSPNDLVYVPTEEEILEGNSSIDNIKKERIYKMVSCTGTECHFVPQNIASPIVNKVEFSPKNKMGRSLTGEMIKDVCCKLTIDRLGNIKPLHL
jgi:CRISPR-associated endonuclease Csn1